MRLKKYITEVELIRSTSETKAIEIALADYYNGNDILKPGTPYEKWIPNYRDMIKELKKIPQLKRGTAKHVGNEYFPTSKEWSIYHTTKKSPPKTDIIVGNKTISIKLGSGRLVSGGEKEITAILYTTADKVKITESSKEELKNIEEHLKMLFMLSPKATARILAVNAMDQLRKDLKEENAEIVRVLTELADRDINFKREFIREAASGRIKFNNNKGAADYIMAIGKTYEVVKYNSIDDESYIDFLTKASGFNTAFLPVKKTGRWAVSFTTELANLRDKTLELIKSSTDFNNENLLTESALSDFISRNWNKIKEKLSDLYEQFTDWITRVFEYATRSLGHLLRYFEITLDEQTIYNLTEKEIEWVR